MGIGDHGRRVGWGSIWLFLMLCAGSLFAPASGAVVLQELRVGQGEAVDIAAMRDGRLDDRLQPAHGAVLETARQRTSWWRITTPATVATADQPQLVLRSPFHNRVQAWLPGRDAPVRRALYGEDADAAHAHRALVFDLPHGIPAGEAVWLRVESAAPWKMKVSIEPAADVRRTDLAYVAWRTLVLTVLLVLAVLAFTFRIGTGESSFAWFGGMLCFAVLYLVAVGGDARLLPGGDVVFGGARVNMIVGGLGVVCSNLFQRSYLDLPGRLPAIDRLLWVGTGLSAACGISAIIASVPGQALLGNMGLVLSAALLLAGGIVLASRGDRAGQVVMASWLPLIVFTTLVASEVTGLWTGPHWLHEALAGSFALASLLLALGLVDKLLELRRDRDHASALAIADRLTGLLNRAGIEAGLRHALQSTALEGGTMSISFVDLDHFKPVNDSHGHGVGDQCLRIVSQRVRNQLRDGDLIGRYGGDEFLVVLPATSLAEAVAVAERMRASVNGRPLTIEQLRLQASLSIGVAEYVPGDSIESLVERADAALYASKQGGRDRVSGAGCAAPQPVHA